MATFVEILTSVRSAVTAKGGPLPVLLGYFKSLFADGMDADGKWKDSTLPLAEIEATEEPVIENGIKKIRFNPSLLYALIASRVSDYVASQFAAFLIGSALTARITAVAGSGGGGATTISALATATWDGSPQTTDPTPVPIPQNGTLNVFNVTDALNLFGTHMPSGATGTHKWELVSQPAGGIGHFNGSSDPMFQPNVENTFWETCAVGQTILKYTFTSGGNTYSSLLTINRPA